MSRWPLATASCRAVPSRVSWLTSQPASSNRLQFTTTHLTRSHSRVQINAIFLYPNPNPNLDLSNPKPCMSLLGYPTVIPYTKFEHFGIIRFRVMLRTNKQTDSYQLLSTSTLISHWVVSTALGFDRGCMLAASYFQLTTYYINTIFYYL